MVLKVNFPSAKGKYVKKMVQGHIYLNIPFLGENKKKFISIYEFLTARPRTSSYTCMSIWLRAMQKRRYC